MKNLVAFALLWLASGEAFAQKIIRKSQPFRAGQQVDLQLKFADSIRISYWDKAEVSVLIAVEVNDGKLNDALVVETSANARKITVKTDFDQELIRQGKREDCPGNNQSYSDGDGYHVCSEINYEVYLPRRADLRVETINGNIFIREVAGPVYAKSISGFLDVSWPDGKGANVALKSITGELYSDLDIDFGNKKEKNPIVGYLLEGTLNGGGPDVRLESISNNIYLRKLN